MHIEAGMILYSLDFPKGDFFENAVILIADVNTDGPWGFVLNKSFDRKFNELVEFEDATPTTLWSAGPMEPEKLFFIHRRPDLIADGIKINDDLYLGGDFDTLVNLLNTGALAENEAKLLLGYCGWDKDQLEAELNEGTWSLETYNPEMVWSTTE